jgi:hypothetical protein
VISEHDGERMRRKMMSRRKRKRGNRKTRRSREISQWAPKPLMDV